MAGERTLRLVIAGDAEQAIRALNRMEQAAGGAMGKVERINQRFGRQIRIATAAGGAALTGLAVKGVQNASALDEAVNKANVTFGESAGLIQEFSRTSADRFGISQRAANEYAGTLGTILNASGLAQDETAGMSVELTKLAADMASFNNIPIDEALEKIRAGLVGETEPLRTVGVLLSADAVKAKALELGLADANGELTEGAKVQARYALIMEQTAAQQGDFTRTSDSLANAQRRLGARTEDLTAKFGSFLVPAVEGVLGVLLKVPTPVLVVGTGLIALGTAIGGVLIVLPLLAAGFTTLITLGPALGVALTAATGPFGLIALAIAGVIAAGVLLITHWDEVKELAGRFASFVAEHIGRLVSFLRDKFFAFVDSKFAALAILLGPAGIIVAVFRFRDQILGAFRFIRDQIGRIIDFLTGRIDDLLGVLERAQNLTGAVSGGVSGAASGVGSRISGAAGRVGGLLGFQTGGIVPGPLGAPRLAVVHGGEAVIPPGRGGAIVLNINMQGSLIAQADLERTIVAAVHQARRRGEPV